MEKKRSTCLLISAIVGTMYVIYSLSHWAEAFEGFNSALTVGLATALIGPHQICAVMAAVFNWVGWAARRPWAALTGAILYTLAALLFPLYAVFVILEAILSFVGFANLRKILADEAQAKRRFGPRPAPYQNGPELDERPAVDTRPGMMGGMSDAEVDALLDSEERAKKWRVPAAIGGGVLVAAAIIVSIAIAVPKNDSSAGNDASSLADAATTQDEDQAQDVVAQDAPAGEPAINDAEAAIVAAFSDLVPEDCISISDAGGITTVSLEDSAAGVELLRAKTDGSVPDGWADFSAAVVSASQGISPLEGTMNVSVVVKDAPDGDIYLTVNNGSVSYDAFGADSGAGPKPFTLAQQQAIDKAKEYLELMGFSRTGLIAQLEFSGFTNEEAVYGVDNCGADWNEQAARKAADYLDLMAFSRQGLIDQLIYEGFTSSEAEYGVAAVGF